MARRIFRALVWVAAAGAFVTLLMLPFTDPDVREGDPDDDPAEWATWRRMHPQTLALDAAGGRTSFRLADTLIVVEFGDEAAGFAPRTVAERGVVNDVVGDVPVVVFVNPDDPQQWAVFSRQLDDRVVELDVEESVLVDLGGDAAWDPVSGLPARGTEQSLDPLPAFTSFDSDFRSFFPDGRVVGEASNPEASGRLTRTLTEPGLR